MTLNGIKRRHFAHFIIGLASFISSGCATIENHKTNGDEDTSQFNHVTTAAAIDQIERALDQAKQEDLPFLAPQHFSMADNALKEAKQLLTENASREKIVQKVAVADAVIRSGKKVKQNIKTILGDALTLKQNLETYNAPKTYGREYDTLVSRLEAIIQQIENGKSEKAAEGHTALVKDLRELEVRSIIQTALGEAKETLQRIQYRNGETLAPFTYQDAKNVVEKAEVFIYTTPYDTKAIERIKQEALFATKRALYITEEVAALSHKANVSLEQVILDEEYRLFRIGRILSTADFRNNSLEVQSEMLANAAKTLLEKETHTEQLITALKQTIDRTQKITHQLSSMTESVNRLKKEKSTWIATQAQLGVKIHTLQAQLKSKERYASNIAKPQHSRQTHPTPAPFITQANSTFTAENQHKEVTASQIKPTNQPATKSPEPTNTSSDTHLGHHSKAPTQANNNSAPSDNAIPVAQLSHNHGEIEERDQIVLIPAQDIVSELNAVNLSKITQEEKIDEAKTTPIEFITKTSAIYQETDQLSTFPSLTKPSSNDKASMVSEIDDTNDIDTFMNPEM